jgi:chemotaxis protein MotB
MNKRTEEAVQRDAAALEVPAQQPEAAASAVAAAGGAPVSK